MNSEIKKIIVQEGRVPGVIEVSCDGETKDAEELIVKVQGIIQSFSGQLLKPLIRHAIKQAIKEAIDPSIELEYVPFC